MLLIIPQEEEVKTASVVNISYPQQGAKIWLEASEVDAEVDCGVEGRGFAKGERKRKLLRLLSGKETHSSCHSVWSLQAPACNGAI